MGYYKSLSLIIEKRGKTFTEPSIVSQGRTFRMTHLKSGKVLDVPEDVMGPGAPAWYGARGWTVEIVS